MLKISIIIYKKEKREQDFMLEPKKYSKETFDGITFNLDFEPTTLDGREVYEVKKENDHYCYMTPAMVDKIFELIPGNKNNRYVDQFSCE